MTFGIDQASLEALPQHERNRVCKQIRQEQIENYVRFVSEERHVPRSNRPNKRNTKVQFGVNHLLQVAIEAFDDKEVTNLLQRGADVNFTTANNTTLLHKSCMVGNVRAAENLLKNGANINAIDGDWWTPLHVACYHDYADVVTLLLSNGADITLLDIDGNFPFDHVMPDYETYDVITEHQTKHGLNPTSQVEIRRARCETLQRKVQESLSKEDDINMKFDGGITYLYVQNAESNVNKNIAQDILFGHN